MIESEILKWGFNKRERLVTMKTKCLRACFLAMATGGISVLVSGCVVLPNGQVGLQLPVISIGPPVVVAAPAVVVEPPVVEVPDSYVWDGYEYVGLVGGAYFYLGPGNVWLACDGDRLERFHGWERGHPDWRGHAIRNDRFRQDAHGHVQPMGHGGPEKGKAKAAPKRKDAKN
jgi:hypothetical protein